MLNCHVLDNTTVYLYPKVKQTNTFSVNLWPLCGPQVFVLTNVLNSLMFVCELSQL